MGRAFIADESVQRPARVGRRAREGWPAGDIKFLLRCINNDATNFAMIRQRSRAFQGYLVSGQNSGTQWLKFMMSLAIAEAFGVPAPRFYNNASSNDIIGHPKHKRIHPHLPRIASSHSIPHYALDWGWLRRGLHFPKYVLLVRDIRDVLISNYSKWRHEYRVPFDVYVAGDPLGGRYVCDVWWYVHFLNRWGAIAERYPDEVLIVHYEDMRREPKAGLAAIFEHFGIAVGEAAIDAAVRGSTKEAMTARTDPNSNETVIRPDADGDAPQFGERENAILRRILRANLAYDFGYSYD